MARDRRRPQDGSHAGEGATGGSDLAARRLSHLSLRSRRGCRPVSYDWDLYRNRNVVERGFNAFMQWPGLASRYDKLAVNYPGGAVLRAIIIWLSDLCHTP